MGGRCLTDARAENQVMQDDCVVFLL